jgi:hypothetical protein
MLVGARLGKADTVLHFYFERNTQKRFFELGQLAD